MIEKEIIELQIIGTLKLMVSTYLLFFLIPQIVFPQEYIDNRLERVMFNIIHMVAIITLAFPLFIYIKTYDILFLIIFFVLLKMFFVKTYYKQSVFEYLRNFYRNALIKTMLFIEQPITHLETLKHSIISRFVRMRSCLQTSTFLYISSLLIVSFYGLYLRMYRSFTSLVAPLVDMYEYYLWNNLLKTNVLFLKAAGCPYRWGAPVLVYTVNMFMLLNTVFLYNLFPILYLLFIFVSVYYFINSFSNIENEKTASALLGILLFAVILPSPICSNFFGRFFTTSTPEIRHLWLISYYFCPNILPNQIDEFSPFIFFWRSTTTLPYELSSSFFVVNLALLINFIKTKRYIYLFLYGETLAIIFSIHGGGVIPAALALMLIGLYSIAVGALNYKHIVLGVITAFLAFVVGNMWMLQFFEYGIPQDIGLVAPFLDKIFKTKRTMIDMAKYNIQEIKLVEPTIYLYVLGITPLFFFLVSIFKNKLRLHLVSTGLIILSLLFIYFATNLGFPAIINLQRAQLFLAYGYVIGFSVLYYIVIEKWFLKTFFKKVYFEVSVCLVVVISALFIAYIPRWIDTKMYRDNKTAFEYTELPYLLNKIEDTFQPFSYTVVSHTEHFHQISKSWHMSRLDFIQKYNPHDTYLKIPTDYIFVFVENIPFKSNAVLYENFDIQNRWRPDLIIKLKEWVSMYSVRHNNITLWFHNANISVYLIDNREYQSYLYKNRQKEERKAEQWEPAMDSNR